MRVPGQVNELARVLVNDQIQQRLRPDTLTRIYQTNLALGAWTSTPPYLQSSYRLVTVPSTISVNSGFRLAGSI